MNIMKKQIQIIFAAALISVVFFSCANNTHREDHKQDEHKQEEHTQDEHKQLGAPAVTLNNGSVWKANTETTAGINNMISLINESENKKDASCKDLGLSLNQEFNQILKKCSMKGEAHEQLHHYLMPIIPVIDKIEQESGDCKTTREELKEYLGKYDNYFES